MKNACGRNDGVVLYLTFLYYFDMEKEVDFVITLVYHERDFIKKLTEDAIINQ